MCYTRIAARRWKFALGNPENGFGALRQELYYCQKYGIEAHVTRKNIPGGAENYARSLLGRVTRALSFEAGDASLARGRAFLVNYLTSENLTSENAEE